MPRTFKDAKAWLDTYECQTEDEQELIIGFQDILEELESEYKKDQEECQYQILYLTYNGNFTDDQKLVAIKYLTTELNFLTSELNIKQKYSEDYPSAELNDIKTQISLVKTELNKYE